MADVSECRSLIPEKYFQTHDYEPEDDRPPVGKNRLNMPDGSIPLDLAFCTTSTTPEGLVICSCSHLNFRFSFMRWNALLAPSPHVTCATGTTSTQGKELGNGWRT